MPVGKWLVVVVVTCLSLVAMNTTPVEALSCEPPQYSYTDDVTQRGQVVVIEGEAWTRSNNDDCDGSPYDDIRVFFTPATGDRVLVARGAADDGGRFLVNVPIPPTMSGRVRVEVIATHSVPGVTTSTPITLGSEPIGSPLDVTPVAFGPVQPDRNLWPWVFVTAILSALAGAAVAWRIATRHHVPSPSAARPTSLAGEPSQS
jgi:hypothetical protein